MKKLIEVINRLNKEAIEDMIKRKEAEHRTKSPPLDCGINH